MKTRKDRDGTVFNSGISALVCTVVNKAFSLRQNAAMRQVRRAAVLLVSGLGLACALPAQSETVYMHAAAPQASATSVNSNALAHPDGSDQDVTAYDNFTLKQSANITSVTWRGSSASKALAGFTIKIYPSQPNPSAQPDIANPLAVLSVAGNANEKLVGNNLSDYRADFTGPLALTAGVQYWISIVSNRNDLSPWGWANGMGGDGKTIQSYAEFKILPAPGDRSFTLNDGSSTAPKH